MAHLPASESVAERNLAGEEDTQCFNNGNNSLGVALDTADAPVNLDQHTLYYFCVGVLTNTAFWGTEQIVRPG
jgi:hypothetical protein